MNSVISILRLIRNVVLLYLFALATFTTTAQTNLNYLKNWAGKYSTNEKEKPVQEFFKLSEIQKGLKEILTKKDFQHLTKELAVQTPIELVKGFLVLKVCRPHCCPCDNAMLVINLDNSDFYAGFYEGYEHKSIIRWFSLLGEYGFAKRNS